MTKKPMYYDEQFNTELKLIYNPDIDVRDKRHFALNMIAIELKNIANELHEMNEIKLQELRGITVDFGVTIDDIFLEKSKEKK